MRRFLIALLLLGTAAGSPAVQIKNVAHYTLPEGRTADEEAWVAADTIDVKGTFKDQLLALANTINLSGDFRDDVWAVGSTIDFKGTGAGHVRFVAKQLNVAGTVGKSLVAVASSLTIASNAVINGDAMLAGESVTSSGHIAGNLRILSGNPAVGFDGNVTIAGRIDGNVRLVADDIVVMPGTVIKGNLVYTSSKDLFLDQKVVLGGQLIRKHAGAVVWTPPTPTTKQMVIVQAFLYFCAIMTAIPFMGVFSGFTGRSVRALREAPWKCGITGFIAFCLMPMVGFFVLLTIVGIPLGVLLFGFYAALVYLSKIIVALTVGGVILRRRGHQPFGRVFTALSFGLVLLYFLSSLPLVGMFFWLLTVMLGLGAMVLVILFGRSFIATEPPPVPATTSPAPPPLPPGGSGTGGTP